MAADTAEVQAHINGEVSSRDSTSEYKEKKKLAKRIIKAVQGSLEDAMHKESELCQKPFEKELRNLDLLLENSLLSRRDSPAGSPAGDASDVGVDEPKMFVRGGSHNNSLGNGHSDADGMLLAGGPDSDHMHQSIDDASSQFLLAPAIIDSIPQQPPSKPQAYPESATARSSIAHDQYTPEYSSAIPPILAGINSQERKPNGIAHIAIAPGSSAAIQDVEPPTPPMSSGSDLQPLSHGGVPWYMDPFDPEGTTIQEERWTGRELVRGMSEELSDMDEEELLGLVDSDLTEAVQEFGDGNLHLESATTATLSRRKAVAKRKRWRGYR